MVQHVDGQIFDHFLVVLVHEPVYLLTRNFQVQYVLRGKETQNILHGIFLQFVQHIDLLGQKAQHLPISITQPGVPFILCAILLQVGSGVDEPFQVAQILNLVDVVEALHRQPHQHAVLHVELVEVLLQVAEDEPVKELIDFVIDVDFVLYALVADRVQSLHYLVQADLGPINLLQN